MTGIKIYIKIAQFTLAIEFTAKKENFLDFKQALVDLFDKISQEEKFV